jgi:hypothetical protein
MLERHLDTPVLAGGEQMSGYHYVHPRRADTETGSNASASIAL